jgi:nicotinate phosphoribosyltransferase
MVPVAKKSAEKGSRGGRKWATRRIGGDGVAEAELVGTGTPPVDGHGRSLLVQYVSKGEVVHRPSLEEIREHHLRSRGELPVWATQLSRGEPAIPTVYED